MKTLFINFPSAKMQSPYSSWRLALILLVLAATAKSVLSTSEARQFKIEFHPERKPTNNESAIDSSRMKMEPRGDDDDDKHKGGQLSLKFDTTVDLDKALDLGKLVKLDRRKDVSKKPTTLNPMISPRYRLQSHTNALKGPPVKDSYLDALEYSHNIKDLRDGDPTKLTRREYTPGPVYRPEGSSTDNNNNNNHVDHIEPAGTSLKNPTKSNNRI